jgi:hypothetical protein
MDAFSPRPLEPTERLHRQRHRKGQMQAQRLCRRRGPTGPPASPPTVLLPVPRRLPLTTPRLYRPVIYRTPPFVAADQSASVAWRVLLPVPPDIAAD